MFRDDVFYGNMISVAITTYTPLIGYRKKNSEIGEISIDFWRLSNRKKEMQNYLFGFEIGQ